MPDTARHRSPTRSPASTPAPNASPSATRATSPSRNDGRRVVFARSRAGDDPVNCLWVLDVATGEERLVADPHELLGALDDDSLPAEERARRERMREGAGGVTAYATDHAAIVSAFTLAGRLFVAGLVSGKARELPVEGPVFDARPDPVATKVAYVSGRSLRIAELDGSSWELAGEPVPTVSWGSADFIAAEEMHRFRGYWWSPDGSVIAACRVDNSPVARWYIANPAEPASRPPRSATRQRAPTTPASPSTCSPSRAAPPRSCGITAPTPTSPPCAGTDGPSGCCSRCSRATSAR